ncbi:hypothetical protein C8F01DRAFT_345452 [Mycena amicta]|nr:hypothetical protein C8F01DRAFT_345452 [Mycena amicta]
MPPQTFLATEEPLDALCHHFSLAKASLPPNTAVQASYTMQVIAPVVRMPTHLLAVLPPPNDPLAPTLLVPVDAHLYHRTFDNATFIPQPPPGVPHPAPFLDPTTQALLVNLPVIPVTVPHAPSFALLLLFGLGLETDRNLLAAHLLPPEAIGEFPNAAAMSGVVSRLRSSQFDAYWHLNQGLWKNILALAATNPHLGELVPMTLKVVADARKLRIRRW